MVRHTQHGVNPKGMAHGAGKMNSPTGILRSLRRHTRSSSFKVLLIVVAAILVRCSASDPNEEWLHAYRRHTNVVKTTAAKQAEVLEVNGVNGDGSCVIPGVVFWPYLTEAWIARVNPMVVSADLRPGDRILGVNGRYVRHLGVLLFRLSRLQSAAAPELTVDRNHELRRVTVRCSDSTAISNATRSLLRAAGSGDWQQCVKLAGDLPSIARVHYSWVAQLRHDCSEALRLKARRKPNSTDATLAHQWARLRLEEAKDIPEAIEQVRGSITGMIYWLRRHGFDHLAEDLYNHLDAYSPHLW